MKIFLFVVVLLGLTSIQAEKTLLFEPTEMIQGSSLAAWGEQWWYWVSDAPENRKPPSDLTGSDCNVNQIKSVWFLSGTFKNGTLVKRDCVVPFGKTIIGPLINFYSKCPLFNSNSASMDNPNNLYLSIDNVSHTTSQLVKYRAKVPCGQSKIKPKFGFDGYYFAIKPLTRGKHVIKINARIIGFSQNIHYNLTVK